MEKIKKRGKSLMRGKKYHVYLDEWEYKKVIESVIHLRNRLIQEGKYTDLADEVLCKLVSVNVNIRM